MSQSDKWFVWLIALAIVGMIQWHGHYVRGGTDNVSFWFDTLPMIIISVCIAINVSRTH